MGAAHFKLSSWSAGSVAQALGLTGVRSAFTLARRLCCCNLASPGRACPMRKVALLALAPLLLANQFTANEFEFSAHFIALIQTHQVIAAKRMLAPNAV